MSWGQPARPAVTNPNNDFIVANPPNDGVSSLEWSPTGNFLVATAWDGDVRDFARERFDFRDARRARVSTRGEGTGNANVVTDRALVDRSRFFGVGVLLRGGE